LEAERTKQLVAGRKKKKEPLEVERARKRRPCRCCTRISQSKSQHRLPSQQHLNQKNHQVKAKAEGEEY
jgi:hypothetical protein